MPSASSSIVRRVVAGGLGLALTAAMTLTGAVAAEATDMSCASGVCTLTLSYSGSPASWTVPPGVTSVTATVAAGSGGYATSEDNRFTFPSGGTGLGCICEQARSLGPSWAGGILAQLYSLSFLLYIYLRLMTYLLQLSLNWIF